MSRAKKEIRYVDWVEYQKCCRCNEFKILDDFSLSRWIPHTVCKECKRVYDKAYREKTKEWRSEKQKEYREKHREELNKKTRERYRENSSKYIEKNSEYRKRKAKENWFAREWFHQRTRNYLKAHNISFSKCQKCWTEWKIELHHPSYESNDMRSYIVPLCRGCHRDIEQHPEECPKPINLLQK